MNRRAHLPPFKFAKIREDENMTSSAVGIINRMLCSEVIGVQRRIEAREKQTDPIYSVPRALGVDKE